MQTSPEQTESCAPDCMISSDSLVKVFVQMIANTSMNKRLTETEKQLHRTFEQVKVELEAMQEKFLKLKLQRKLR